MSEEVVYNEMVPFPENIGFEETIIGPLKKMQLVKLMFPAIIGIGISYALNLSTMLKFAVTGICLLVGAVFAYKEIDNIPLDKVFVNWFSYRARPRQVYDKEQNKNFVDVDEIYESTAKVQGGQYVRVVEVSGCNFEFMSSAEKVNIILGFEQFLNSIDSKVQIVARPEEFNPKEYHDFVNERLIEVQGKDEKLRVALEAYMVFFEQFTKGVIEHRFYAIVSTDLKRDAGESTEDLVTNEQKLEKANEILDIRANNIISALGGMNLQGRQLDGAELVKLFERYYGGGL